MGLISIFYHSALVLSMIGVTFHLIVIIVNKLYKRLLFELITLFFINVLLYTISLSIFYVPSNNQFDPNIKDEILCIIQGFFVSYFEIGQFLWASMVSHSIYLNVVSFDKDKQANFNFKMKITYYIIGFFVPLIISVFLLLKGWLGPSSVYCWINTSSKRNDTFVIELVCYVIIWILVLYNVYITYKILKFISLEFEKEGLVDQGKEYRWNLLMYPLTPLFVIVPATVKRTLDFFINLDNHIILAIFVMLIALQGTFYSLSYSLNKDLKMLMKPTLLCIFCCNSDQLKDEGSINTIEEENRHSSLHDSFSEANMKSIGLLKHQMSDEPLNKSYDSNYSLNETKSALK